MDTSVIIIGSILVALTILPMVLISRSRKQKARLYFQKLRAAALAQNREVSLYEASSRIIMGMDQKAKTLFYLKPEQEAAAIQSIDLSTISDCKVFRVNRTVGENGSQQSYLGQIGLRFIPRKKAEQESRWVLYDSEEDMQLNGELQFAEKWAGLIVNEIRANA
ncbi:MAG: hypothetical protein AB7E36_14500 [Salinivirgaceae bacterium]